MLNELDRINMREGDHQGDEMIQNVYKIQCDLFVNWVGTNKLITTTELH